MQFSQNEKIFPKFFSAFPESVWNLKYFEKNDQPWNLFASDIIDCKEPGYLNAQKAKCQNTYRQWTC